MKFRTQLIWFPLCIFFVICIVASYTVIAWSDMQTLFDRSEYVDEILSSVDEMQHTLRDYKGKHEIRHIKHWERQQKSLRNFLENHPPFSPSQQTLINSIKLNNQSMVRKVQYLIADRANPEKTDFNVSELMLDQLFISMELISEDTYELNAYVSQELKSKLKVQLTIVATALIAGSVVLLFLSVRVSQRLQNYLAAMNKGLAKVRNGELNSPIQLNETDERNELTAFIGEFNRLSSQLQETMVSRNELQQIIDEKTVSLKKLANTDPLTQVSNRRKLIHDGNIEIERACRYQHPLSVLIIDADNFKQINDSYSHNVGDRVLINLCRIFEKEVRGVDTIARYGGEEFVILLPETSLSSALEIAERIRHQVSEQPFYAGNDSIEVTISVGVASFSDESDLIALIDKADHALYEAKASGKNAINAHE